MALVDELNATTERAIRPKKIFDLAFKKKSPFLAKLRDQALTHDGGAFIQNTMLLGKTVGGSYAKGQTFTLARPQLLDVTQFDMRYYQQSDVQLLEEIRVENVGAAKVFSILETHQEAMILTMNEMLAIALYRHGQASASTITDNRITELNGLAEAFNDGVTNSWDGNVFPTYGRQTRNSGLVGSALNSIPYWGGDSSGNPGAISYGVLLQNYLDAMSGDMSPSLIVGNKAIYGYILQRIQPMQRIGQESNISWGAESFTILGAKFMLDEYAPSSVYGVNDPRTGNYLTAAFTSAASPATASNLPASTTVTPGETLWVYTMPTFQLQIAKDKLYQFGWTGYQKGIDSTIVAGQMLFGGNILCQAPSYNKQMYGFNS